MLTKTKMNLLNMHLSTVTWETYLPCTVINLKTWENIFNKNDLQFYMKKIDIFILFKSIIMLIYKYTNLFIIVYFHANHMTYKIIIIITIII